MDSVGAVGAAATTVFQKGWFCTHWFWEKVALIPLIFMQKSLYCQIHEAFPKICTHSSKILTRVLLNQWKLFFWSNTTFDFWILSLGCYTQKHNLCSKTMWTKRWEVGLIECPDCQLFLSNLKKRSLEITRFTGTFSISFETLKASTSQCPEIDFNKVSNTIHKTYIGLSNMLQGFQKCMA